MLQPSAKMFGLCVGRSENDFSLVLPRFIKAITTYVELAINSIIEVRGVKLVKLVKLVTGVVLGGLPFCWLKYAEQLE
ncbi:MAG: hypothetical protein ABL898_11865 [Hyphomicrobiaceae bacterium]|nr:hypothetical protein [Hyphomicrobiaceae bacterium]